MYIRRVCWYSKIPLLRPPLGLGKNGLYSVGGLTIELKIKKKSMKWDFKMVVLIVEWS